MHYNFCCCYLYLCVFYVYCIYYNTQNIYALPIRIATCPLIVLLPSLRASETNKNRASPLNPRTIAKKYSYTCYTVLSGSSTSFTSSNSSLAIAKTHKIYVYKALGVLIARTEWAEMKTSGWWTCNRNGDGRTDGIAYMRGNSAYRTLI